MDPTGLEPAGSGGQVGSGSMGYDVGSGVGAQIDAHDFPVLAEIAAAWPSLGEKVQRTLLAYVRACQRSSES